VSLSLGRDLRFPGHWAGLWWPGRRETWTGAARGDGHAPIAPSH